MGDLIHKLPTDEILMSNEEKEGLLLLFGTKEKQDAPPQKPEPPAEAVIQQETVIQQEAIVDNKTGLAREGSVILIYIIFFFLASRNWINHLLETYIPLCKNSWIIRDSLKAVIFALFLWIILNRTYMSISV
jgi:hypothetical protein